jgi:hypothetical protein
VAEGLIMTVLKENNIELSENDLKQGWKGIFIPLFIVMNMKTKVN